MDNFKFIALFFYVHSPSLFAAKSYIKTISMIMCFHVHFWISLKNMKYMFFISLAAVFFKSVRGIPMLHYTSLGFCLSNGLFVVHRETSNVFIGYIAKS